MAEHKGKKKHPKRATDKRRQYAATIGAMKVDGSATATGNGAASGAGLFNDRRVNLGKGKRAT